MNIKLRAQSAGDRFFYACCFFVIAMPFSISINNLSIFVLCIGWIFEKISSKEIKKTFLKGDLFSIAALFVVYLCSLAYTQNLDDGWRRVETKLGLIAFPILLSNAVLNRNHANQILKVFLISLVVISCALLALAAFRYTNSHSLSEFFYHQLTSPLGLNAIYFAYYWCLACFFLVLSRPFPTKMLFLLLMFSGVMIILLSALAVSAFLVVFIACFGTWTVIKSSASFKLTFFYIAVLLTLGAFTYSFSGMKQKIDRINSMNYEMEFEDFKWNSITIRLAMWQCALPIIVENFVLGSGIGDENDQLQDSYRKHNFKEGIRCNYNVHNQYLSTSLSVGAIGLFTLLALLVLPLYSSIKNSDWLLFSFLVMISFSFLSENVLSTQKGVAFFSFFYSLLLVTMPKQDSKISSRFFSKIL